MRIALDTLGCKLNQAETEQLSRALAEAGHVLVDSVERADVYVLNTCTVTATADGKARQLLRQARRRNPAVRVVAAGCYVDRARQELAVIDGVELVVGNGEKANLASLLGGGDEHPQDDATGVPPAVPRTRSFVKIQDGCATRCSYCIVPLVRGHETSLPADDVVREVSRRADEGYQEVVLTGTKVGTYRDIAPSQDGETDLPVLLRRVLAETGVPRLRLSSLQPGEISPELLRLWENERLCPHFHLSVQSGSDSVLERMQRGYRTADFARTVSLVRERVPAAAITTDVIVGFPGETDAEFEESLDFCRRMGFARIHVFPFSPRSGTEAAGMPDRVDAATTKHRTRLMLALAEESAAGFRQRFSGETLTVLWEQRTRDGRWSGVTENYLRVQTDSEEDLTNRLLPLRLP
jgi:threonylcarbamoyladenosine tRNA methylthiotransferase MtaB